VWSLRVAKERSRTAATHALRSGRRPITPKEPDEEGPHHLAGGIGASRIGVRSHCASTRPGMADAMRNPLLQVAGAARGTTPFTQARQQGQK
jgi:hypothetical protein